jgi:predicted ATPase
MTLLLDSLRIENYRTFRHLEIERLGRATLVVGRNNSGKTSVLEAVRLFASRGDEEVILSILESHDEITTGSEPAPQAKLLAVKQLFHGRDAGWNQATEIRIGPSAGQDHTLTLRIGPIKEAQRRLTLISNFGGRRQVVAFREDWRERNGLRSKHDIVEHASVTPNGLTAESMAKLWDLIALTDLEEDVTEALRIISPEIQRISFIGEETLNRIPVAKLGGLTRPVPLRSLGDGVNRMLGIALSLVSARGGVLLIDEIENGIHFTAQKHLWKLVLESAHRLSLQVFATTHSWDCIQAFQRAAANEAREDASLVRLDLRKGSIVPTTISEHDLSIVTREQIEVR